MQYWKHCSIPPGIQELIRMPTGSKRSGFRFSISDCDGYDKSRIVECRTESMGQRIPQFAALMNGSWGVGSDVAWNSSGKCKLCKKPPQPRFVLSDIRIVFAACSFQIEVRQNR